MVPGSTLRYGSSFWRETERCRAFRMFPIEAAVIPLPREETTPPVTKTYFDMVDLQGGFMNSTDWGPAAKHRSGSGLCSWLQKHHLGLPLPGRGRLHRQLGLGFHGRHRHLP